MYMPRFACYLFPGGSASKESTCKAGGDQGSTPGLGRFSWKRKWQPTPVFLPGKSHGQRSLAGYSPWGWKRVGHDLVTKQHQQNAFWKCFDLRGPFGTVENAHDCIYFHEIIGF